MAIEACICNLMRLCNKLKISLFIEVATDEVTLVIEGDFENGDSNRHGMDQCPQKSSDATSAYGNFFWFWKFFSWRNLVKKSQQSQGRCPAGIGLFHSRRVTNSEAMEEEV